MGSHPAEPQTPLLSYQAGFRDCDVALGTSTGMGSLFDEFAAYSTFNFFADTSHYE